MSNYTEDTLFTVFALDEHDYCISCKSVDAIVIPKPLTPLPKAPSHLIGITEYKGRILPVIELRVLLGMPSLAEYVEQFSRMKQMHIDWVDTLKEALENRHFFSLPVDPHKCRFGQWYDHYETDNYSINFVLKKLAAPHARIHQCGATFNGCLQKEDFEGAAQCVEQAKSVCYSEMIPLLDQLIETYQEIFRGIYIVLSCNEKRIALFVDEIKELIPAQNLSRQELPDNLKGNGYLECLQVGSSGPIIELNTDSFFTDGAQVGQRTS